MNFFVTVLPLSVVMVTKPEASRAVIVPRTRLEERTSIRIACAWLPCNRRVQRIFRGGERSPAAASATRDEKAFTAA